MPQLTGFLMLLDLPQERGGSDIDLRWGEPRDCHFPLFEILKPLPVPYMALLYGIMCLGACGIMLGYKFRLSTLLFGVPYWYVLLLDKSYWNNHSYLYGLVIILLMGSSANHYFALDGLIDCRKQNAHVPYWNYFILKFQFCILYFFAGMKKTDMEWLEGYSMTNLGSHWVFLPFRLLLNIPQIDYLVVHWFGFLLDLTIAFWMLLDITRPIALVFCACFHLMNSRLFSIGMFPYVCLATLPLFCAENWPKKILTFFSKEQSRLQFSSSCVYPDQQVKGRHDLQFHQKITWKHKLVVTLLLSHCGLQTILPYSHFITKGYNNWTNGLYGYSWDMMVHSWDTVIVVVKLIDNNSESEYFLDPSAWTQNERWSKHADMCVQYAHCLYKNIVEDLKKGIIGFETNAGKSISENISIYVDVWTSMNGRFQQRMFDPTYDLLKSDWSPFKQVTWLKPIMSEYSDLRVQMSQITSEVYSWSNYSDVLFIADFPGLFLENYISLDLKNISLTVLEGEIYYEIEDKALQQSYGVRLGKGQSKLVEAGMFHKIHTTSLNPSCYMYTYVNQTIDRILNVKRNVYSPLPLVEDIQLLFNGFTKMFEHIINSLKFIFNDTPFTIRRQLKISK